MSRTVGQRTASITGRAAAAPSIPLNLPSRVQLRVSLAGFRKLCRANPELRLERSALGNLEVMSPTGSASGSRNARLITRLGNWTEADGAGEFFDSSAGFTLPNGAIRSPDASWISNQRWNVLSLDQKQSFAPICPDFVVELCSPSDEKAKLQDKLAEYIAQGARLGWLIDPTDLTVEIYRPGQPVESLHQPPSLSGETVLPGFVLDLQGILFD